MQKIQAEDEWCVEAYMDTDYSTITDDEFENELKQYAIFDIQHGVNTP